ncbi:hypothetical protein [Kitasatospora brasiliensis]|uniref:hypothetical protein n=1 Tax=Kitasatospora brasiliensis TaxID=3058040 RepID=UPI00293127D2|nr:hypothetical protein [Kitasatospora sp. K002]
MTPVKNLTSFPTAVGPAAAAGRTAEGPARGRVATVEVLPLWAAPWSARASAKR